MGNYFKIYINCNYLINNFLKLNPSDKVIISEWEQDLADAKEFVRKLNVIVTNKDKEQPDPEPEKEINEVVTH